MFDPAGLWSSAVAVVCVALMGLAIQRGGTCTVAAVEEMLSQRRAYRLGAMLDASLWVAGGLALASLGGIAGGMPGSYAVNRWTFIGGALLGLGAWVNGSCVFGTVAKIGSGDWAYALTPLGYFLGCWVLADAGVAAAMPANSPSPTLHAALVVGPLFLVYAIWRIAPALRGPALWWTPHNATVTIGITFVITLLVAGRWSYTEALSDLAQAMGQAGRQMLGLPLLLVLALFGGAMLGGSQGALKDRPAVTAKALARCLAGGLLMGAGGSLIPGSNDGLILVGLPLLRPYAWLAFATMCATIALAIGLQRRWSQRSPARAA